MELRRALRRRVEFLKKAKRNINRFKMRYKNLILSICLTVLSAIRSNAQETVYPALAQAAPVYLTSATIHIGNGQVITNGTIGFANGKIISVGNNSTPAPGAKVIDCGGHHIYPGLIAGSGNLGLAEVSSIKSTNDYAEIGQLSPSVRSLVAYNVDSKVINTLRSNGILLAHIVPQGRLIAGTSSVVQLDAWNYKDAVYKKENAIHFYVPGVRTEPSEEGEEASGSNIQRTMNAIQQVRSFLTEAKAYLKESSHAAVNLNYEAVKGLYDHQQKLFIHCNGVKEMLMAIDLGKEQEIDIVIVGGTDSWMIADLLRQNNISVMLNTPHRLPVMQDDDIDQPYKAAWQLQKAGVLFCIGQEGSYQLRNIMFNAGTTAAYGLTKEEALAGITMNTAKILGIDSLTGTLETGKDANILVCAGDILDMRTSIILRAYIQGREIDLDDKHKQLNERYKRRYELK